MTISAILLLFLLLQTKHLIIDWIWQPEYEWKNKGTYGHFGGIRHAGKNAIGTGICFYIFVGLWAIPIAVFDFMIHYHIDWSKMNINKKTGWGPLTHCQFWWLTGFDQYLHQITYIFLIYLATAIS
jgi:Protein of unknown function (DUF3307).